MLNARIALLCSTAALLATACGEAPSSTNFAARAPSSESAAISRPDPIPAKGNYAAKHLPNLDGGARYLAYYGTWTDEKIEAAWDSRLVIGGFHSSDIKAPQIRKLRRGRDGIWGTADDVTVIAYLSPFQERDLGGGPAAGDGRGPLQLDDKGGIIGHAHAGVAGYYVDALTQDRVTFKTLANVPDGKPDVMRSYKGYRIDPSDDEWHRIIRAQTDHLLIEQGCDGVFLDMLDMYDPEKPYAALLPQAYEFVRWLKEKYPDKYLVANRGYFFFESNPKRWWSKYNLRPFVSAVMLENHYTEWENGQAVWSRWAGYPVESPVLNAESVKSDGFRILVLDYINPTQSDCAALMARQRAALEADGGGRWLNFVTDIHLKTFGYTGCQ